MSAGRVINVDEPDLLERSIFDINVEDKRANYYWLVWGSANLIKRYAPFYLRRFMQEVNMKKRFKKSLMMIEYFTEFHYRIIQ